MMPAARPRARDDARLLVVDPCRAAVADARVTALPELLRAGDLVVVNDAATLPASLSAVGDAVEVRLAGELDDGCHRAVLFGAGDWRTPTERRPPPPRLGPGDRLRFGGDLAADIVAVSPLSPRLVTLRFTTRGAELCALLYAHGRLIQYSHVDAPLELWDFQTAYGSRPWAVEPPSAGLPLSAATLLGLRRAGVGLAALTHAAGLSATGDPALDAALPLPERYDIPAETAAAVAAARRVVAVGTTVVRALEGAARSGRRTGTTDLRIGPGFRPRVVAGVLTGLHEPGSSHLELLGAFAPRTLLERATAHAAAAGYRGHELGDVSLVLCA
jgi:S-adenosylmethionine:tRNA ribosyltransferase-isomerase